jgi:molybdate transport repressor ModE-like protein
LAIKRCGSISAAARQLGVTPSQVSKATSRLERQLRTSLLVRAGRGVLLTDVAQRIVPEFEEITIRLQRLQQRETAAGGQLTLAAPSYLATPFLPLLVRDQSHLHLRALELSPALIRAYAPQNLFDAALTVGPERLPDTWVSEHIGDLRLTLFATPALARTLGPQPVQVERVREIPFISPIFGGTGPFVPGEDGCPLGYGERVVGHEVHTIGLALELAKRTQQLVFGPAIAGRRSLEQGELCEIRVRGWDVKQALHFACNANRVLSRVQSSTARTLRKGLAELQRRDSETSPSARR